MKDQATYPWTRDGVAEAVEDAMDCWPRLREAFVVASTPGEGSAASDTWDVRLDPHGNCRVARILSDGVQRGALQQVAQALRAALPEKSWRASLPHRVPGSGQASRDETEGS